MKRKPQTAQDIARIATVYKKDSKPICFVIMSFSGNPILETYYEEAVKPIVADAGLECIRVDQEGFNGQISERIRTDIQCARLIIADLTEDRPNCYFEVGYAVAKGKPIIFQRLKAPLYESKLPFDVKDFPHIIYGTASDLRERLRKRITALLNDK